MSLRDPIAGLTSFALSLTFFILSFNYSGGSEMFPRLVAGIMLACSALLFLRGILRPTEGERMSPEAIRRVAIGVVLTLAYIAAVALLGFLTASLIYIPLSAISLGLRSYWTIGITTILYVGGVYYLFHNIFYTPLPQELILKLF
jgi:Tripartite tricarboxylate transporter TctB family